VDWSSILVAVLVFLSIYLMFFLISVFSDMYIVGIALTSAGLAYSIRGFEIYPYLLDFLEYTGITHFLSSLGLNLSTQADNWSVFLVSAIIVMMAVFFCIPFLPFSDTYRKILGVEKPVSTEEARIRHWILEEVERIRKEERMIHEAEQERLEQERPVVTEITEPTPIADESEVKKVSS